MNDPNLTTEEREALEIALGKTEPKPWPSTLAEDLAVTERILEEEWEHLADRYGDDPPCRRSDKELGRLLSILDSLECEKGASHV